MKMIHEKHEKKIKIIRVNSCNSWASFFNTSQGEAAAIMTNYHEKSPQITQIYTNYKKNKKSV
jgi:hypothetical protein